MAGTYSQSSAALSHSVRLLWDIAPPLRLNSDTPYIAAGAIHLPSHGSWPFQLAAAAHAAAHLVYSPCTFDGTGLGPIARTLMGLLEDARVETLAIREFPGLARLWRSQHTATPVLGASFEALMVRLSRQLIDPGYDDPERWVRKGQALFIDDICSQRAAIQMSAAVRKVATQLGHDIGQMRLPFNEKTYRPQPAYRDDHRWMWAADVLHAVQPPATATVQGFENERDLPHGNVEGISRYPEWDRLIDRLRPDWCTVLEESPLPATIHAALTGAVGEDVIQQTAGRLRRALRNVLHSSTLRRRHDEGETFDPAGLVEWRVAWRTRSAADTRVYRGIAQRVARPSVWILIDQSASTSACLGSRNHSVLQEALASAIAIATALNAMDVACAICGFSSYGRHAVRMIVAKSFATHLDDAIPGLQSLRSGGSTRLGAALRNVTSQLKLKRQGPRWILVLSDGEPHDVDTHDPQYLMEDARHAVAEARREGVRLACPVFSPNNVGQAQRIFGRAGVQPVRDIDQLPGVLKRLLARGNLRC